MTLAMVEAGADIAAVLAPWDPPVSELAGAVQSLGRKLEVFRCNVGNSAALRGCFQTMWTSGIVPDILLNCSILTRRGPVETMTDDEIDAVSAEAGAFTTFTRTGCADRTGSNILRCLLST